MVLIILLALILLALAVAFWAYSKAFYMPLHRRCKPLPLPGSEQYARVKDRSDALIAEMTARPYEDVFIRAADDTVLFARYYHIADGAPLHIQMHGYRSNGLRDFCGIHKLARSLGHNMLMVDQRAHGKSGGRTITFGIRERTDCLCWVNYAIERFGKDVPVLLSGVSMGAATVLMASGLDLPENVVGIIADSPYSAPALIIGKVCRDMHLPPALAMPFVHLGAGIFGRFDLNAASAVEAVKKSRVPIMLVHGEDDRFVPWEMSIDIRNANPEKITCATFPEAGHVLSYMVDTDRYIRIMNEFIHRCIPD